MKKKNLRRDHSGFDSDFDSNSGKNVSGGKGKSSKHKLSIYDEYDDVDESYVSYEKFKGRHK